MKTARSFRITATAAVIALVGGLGVSGMAIAAPQNADPRFVQAATGGEHSLFVAESGALYSVGYNTMGQLGRAHEGQDAYSVAPAEVTGFPRGTRIIQAAAGSEFSLALASDGRVFSWGKGDRGQLGNGSRSSASSPSQVQGLPGDDPVAQVSTGKSAAYAVTTSGRVFHWGEISALGDGAQGTVSPIELKIPASPKIVKVANHENVAMALSDAGQVYSWSYIKSGEAGRPGPLEVPVHVTGLPSGDPVIDIASGLWRSAVATASGKVYRWDTRLVPGTKGPGSSTIAIASPVLLAALPAGDPVVALGSGPLHGIAATASGAVYSWGSNLHGTLGDGTNAESADGVARGIGMLADDPVASVAGGGHTSFVVTRSGAVYGAGLNNVASIGDQSTVNRNAFTAIQIKMTQGSVTVEDAPDMQAGTVQAKVTPAASWPSETVLAYQWTRNGEAIEGATESIYKLVAQDVNAEVRVTVNVTAINHSPYTIGAEPMVVTALPGEAAGDAVVRDLPTKSSAGATSGAASANGLAGTGANALLIVGLAATVLVAGIAMVVIRRRIAMRS